MRILLSIFILFFISFANAEISSPYTATLDNGLRYTILPLHEEKERLEIRLKINAGMIDENDDQAGVAHMVEHLVFRATEKHPTGIMSFLHQNHWVRGKNYNAVTTNDSTTYMMTPPAKAGLSDALSALSQMVFYAQLTSQDLDKERKIILEEWRAGQGVAKRMSQLRTNSVRVDSGYTRHPVIGTFESINNMPVSQLQKFYHKWYVPNNMHLLIVGDIRIDQAEKLIKQYFATPTSQSLPTRNYYEPKLTNILRINQLQDPQSGVSQVAFIVRFDESKMREQTEQGRYKRLLDRLAVALVTQRLRNQVENLQEGVNTIVLRKSDIGKTTVALGIFAGVEATSQQKGLIQIFQEIERLKRYPITQQELDDEKQKIQEQIEQAKKHKNDRDFTSWVEQMVTTELSNKPYYTQPEIAKLTEPMLHKITLQEINQHIKNWFIAQDRIVQYQAPRLTKITPITQEFVFEQQKQISQAHIEPPKMKKIIEPMLFTDLEQQGKIISTTYYKEQNVYYFQLSNGDKFVWFKSPLAKERSYFEARSSAGFKGEDLTNWKSQIAVQLILQNAPLNWKTEQLTQWKTLNKINILSKQTENELIFTSQIENNKLGDMFRLYYAYQQETKIKEGLDEVKKEINRTLDLNNQKSPQIYRLAALNKMLYGKESIEELPNKAMLEQLSQQDLNQEWEKMVSAPVTYYLVNNMTETELKNLIENYLANIPRKHIIKSNKILPNEGKKIERFAMNLAPKDEVQLWSFTPYSWSGKDAILVSILSQIATNQLKLSLRDKHLGVYSLQFNSTLNPNTNRIESELKFSSDPKMTDKLLKLVENVFIDLPEQISQKDIQIAKANFLNIEKERLKSPYHWLTRLILSDKQLGNPKYLMEVNYLADAITLENAKNMAKNLYNKENAKIFITIPVIKNTP